MMQSKQSIEREIRKMQKYNEIGEDDIITKRLVYCMSELLRWSIKNTTAWENPLQQAISHSKILKDELKQDALLGEIVK